MKARAWLRFPCLAPHCKDTYELKGSGHADKGG